MLGRIKNVEYGEIPPPFDYLIAVCWVLFTLNLIMTVENRKVKAPLLESVSFQMAYIERTLETGRGLMNITSKDNL